MRARIIKYLMKHSNEYISGEQIAHDLKISRNAVWKNIGLLKTLGYQIESQHRLGYRYIGMPNLAAVVIENSLSHSVDVLTFDVLASTNKYAKQMALEHLHQPTAIIANQQTSGYGRYGRHFYSPADTGLYLSLVVPIKARKFNAGLLTTGIATVVAQVLEVNYGITVGIKWVNDLIYHSKKIAGIMTEGLTDLETGNLDTVIIGVGLNLGQINFPNDLDDKAGSLNLGDIDRNLLAAQIIDEILTLMNNYLKAEFMVKYRELSIIIGKHVELNRQGELLAGIVEDIDNNGALILKTHNELIKVNSGEIKKTTIVDGEYNG